MTDERAFIQRVEQAEVDEFAHILARPSPNEERALRAYFGDERYKRLHTRALRRSVRGPSRGQRGNVVVIHGIMGGELTAHRAGDQEHIWAHVFSLIRGEVTRLRLADDGRTDYEQGVQVHASGIMKSAYGEILMALAERWNVRGYWFDWRKDIALAAAELETSINGWFGPNAPVHLVAHSMGGLVARAMIRDREARWKKMWDKDSSGRLGGRLIMLGTPNSGSFAIPQVITGLEGMVRKLAAADLRHSLEELLPTFNSFVGSYQMLPSPFEMPDMEWLYDAKSYSTLNIPQAHLDNARRHHESLRSVIDTERMVYIAGYNTPTFSGIVDRQPANREAYTVSREGDGRVTHRLGFLKGVANYFVEENHGDLPANEAVLAAVEDLLETGRTTVLKREKPQIRSAGARVEAEQAWKEQDEDVAKFTALIQRARARSEDPAAQQLVSSIEHEIRDGLTSGFLPSSRPAPRAPAVSARERRAIKVQVALVPGDISHTDAIDSGEPPIDAVAVGHYIGGKPQYAELALDVAISAALSRGNTSKGTNNGKSQGILAQYSERGTLRGELGQPFFLSDPRVARGRGHSGRVIAIMGMGFPGRFGEPELTVASRELCWSLGRLGHHHIATVLIGAGDGNLSTRVAVRGWLRGIRHALAGSDQDEHEHLRRITFVELDPRRVVEINDAISTELQGFTAYLDIEYIGPSADDLAKLRTAGSQLARKLWLAQHARRSGAVADDGTGSPPPPTQLTVDLNQGVYRFGAITNEASIPERNIALDPALVMKANDELIGEGDADLQRKRGEFLGKLLVPAELRGQLATTSPIVMMMDSMSARIHWEMIARAEATGAAPTSASADHFEEFLGTSRGFTRQLRTTFAPPPEPPPPPRRVLRVLIVADPAADAHLPGAEAEGAEIAQLFRAFNTVYGSESSSRIEVTTLFGPTEATRTNVLSELMTVSYDVLHFAGHCSFSKDPRKSGWVFSQDERLTANELNRVDRIPKFVFSNACESGVLPDRPADRNAELAPSFAEAFFARGVANFVCTAWPVDDTAAREFALTLYAGLLGLRRAADWHERHSAATPLPMCDAMCAARRWIAQREYGARTWGAYQHYGNPYLQLFNPEALQQNKEAPKARVTPANVAAAKSTKRGQRHGGRRRLHRNAVRSS